MPPPAPDIAAPRMGLGARLLAPAAVGMILLAALLAAAPALTGGPDRWAALALLASLAAVATLVLPVLRRLSPEPAPATEAQALVEALPEPAAIAAEDGLIEGANVAWTKAVGARRRLQRTPLAGAEALLRAAARDGHAAHADLALGDGRRRVEVAQLPQGRFLVRLRSAEAPATFAAPAPAPLLVAPPKLDAFAVASPF